jgi:hypothetical protein
MYFLAALLILVTTLRNANSTMAYAAETCYLGAIGHGTDPGVQRRNLEGQGYKYEYFLKKLKK